MEIIHNMEILKVVTLNQKFCIHIPLIILELNLMSTVHMDMLALQGRFIQQQIRMVLQKQKNIAMLMVIIWILIEDNISIH
jgi:hypothetical protein